MHPKTKFLLVTTCGCVPTIQKSLVVLSDGTRPIQTNTCGCVPKVEVSEFCDCCGNMKTSYWQRFSTYAFPSPFH